MKEVDRNYRKRNLGAELKDKFNRKQFLSWCGVNND